MLSTLLHIFRNIEMRLSQVLLFRHFPPDLAYALNENKTYEPLYSPNIGVLDINDGILWGVPKSRRTVEKRLNRKFGWPDHVWKPLKAKTNLVACNTCGNHHEVGYLCQTCYERIKSETDEIKERIQAELKLDPVDKEVVVLYTGEEDSRQFHQGKRIVEMVKARPPWFTRNLLQKTSSESPPPAPGEKTKDLG